MNTSRFKNLLLQISISCLLSTACHGETDVIFSPANDIQALLINSINGCSGSIDLAISDLGSGELIQALTDAKTRGVEIRMVVDYQSARPKSSLITHLKEEGFLIKALNGEAGGHMNNNFAVFNGKLLITGTYDWTNKAPKYSHDNVVLIDDSSVINSYRTEFDRLYNKEDHLAWTDLKSTPTDKQKTSKKLVEVPLGKVPSPRDVPFPKLAEGDKKFVDVTINELDALFGSQSTLSAEEQDELWEQQYNEKYVKWYSAVAFGAISQYDWNTLRLSLEIGKEPEVLVLFKPECQQQILQLEKGDVIAYTARLTKRKGMGTLYKLDDGDLVGKLTKKAPR